MKQGSIAALSDPDLHRQKEEQRIQALIDRFDGNRMQQARVHAQAL